MSYEQRVKQISAILTNMRYGRPPLLSQYHPDHLPYDDLHGVPWFEMMRRIAPHGVQQN